MGTRRRGDAGTGAQADAGTRGRGDAGTRTQADAGTKPALPRRTVLRLGFTLIELLIVMSIVVILISIAIPLYQRTLIRSKESVLRANLQAIRTVIDEYTYDKQKAPQSLQDIVQEGYLREVPRDPMTDNNTSWRIVMEDATQSVSQTEPGIFDVHSGSDKMSLDGTPYSDW